LFKINKGLPDQEVIQATLFWTWAEDTPSFTTFEINQTGWHYCLRTGGKVHRVVCNDSAAGGLCVSSWLLQWHFLLCNQEYTLFQVYLATMMFQKI